MLKLIVFDWDGTLVNSVDKIIECKNFLANKYSLPLPSEVIIKKVLGTKFEDALIKCFPSADSITLSKLSKEFHLLMQTSHYQAPLFPMVKEVLEMLKKRGIKLAIATAKNRKELDRAILYNKLSNIFDIICCGDEYQSKPDPIMLKYIMEKFNVNHDECIMIGDTKTDLLFATNAKVKAIGVTFGAHSITELQAAHPIALISEWAQLPEVIDKLCCEKQVF